MEITRAQITEEFDPTAEQLRIIQRCVKGESFAIRAYAGAGKTSTLFQVAKAIKQHFPEKKILYLAFNKSIVSEAEKKFGGIVDVRTAHAFARQKLIELYGYSFTSDAETFEARVYRNEQVHRIFAQQIEPLAANERSGKKQLTPEEQIEKRIKLEVNYLLFGDKNREEYLKRDPRNKPIWDELEAWVRHDFQPDINNEDHDFYLKLLQLKHSNKSFGYDVILYDECQDCSGAMFAAVQSQPNEVQRIYVGDPYQAIYGWRGALNAFESIKRTDMPVETLSKSFRFGALIAELATLLIHIAEASRGNEPPTPLIGSDQPSSILLKLGWLDYDLIVGKENRTLISAIEKFAATGRFNIEVSAPLRKKLFDFGQSHLIEKKETNRRSVAASTVHSIKGDQRPRVLALGDLGRFCDGFIDGRPSVDMDELLLTYVAVTRAQEVINIGPMLGNLRESIRQSKQAPLGCSRVLTLLGLEQLLEERKSISVATFVQTPAHKLPVTAIESKNSDRFEDTVIRLPELVFKGDLPSGSELASKKLQEAMRAHGDNCAKIWQEPVGQKEVGRLLEILLLPDKKAWILLEQDDCLKKFAIGASDARAANNFDKGTRLALVRDDAIWSVRTA